MPAGNEQLSLTGSARIELEYHPLRQPPDATGPEDDGAFRAVLSGVSDCTGWGRSAPLALAALAEALRHHAENLDDCDGVAPASHALAAAQRLPRERLLWWLAERAGEPVLSVGPVASKR